MQHKGKLYEFC